MHAAAADWRRNPRRRALQVLISGIELSPAATLTKNRPQDNSPELIGGDEEDRTPDLRIGHATLTLTHPALFKMLLAKVSLAELIKAAEAKLEGDPKALGAVFANLDNFDPLFNIVTP